MSVLVLVQGNYKPGIDPANDENYKAYQAVGRVVVPKHGGQLVGRGKGLKAFGGDGKATQNGIVMRFPDLASVEAWLNDPEYQKVIPLRNQVYADIKLSVYQE